MQASTLQAMFWGFALAMGLSMSTIFVAYTGVSIAQTFFAVAAAFMGLSLWGYTTKKDLSGWGTFLIMGVVGLLVAMLINAFFVQSVGMDLAISAIGVLIFAGLTAYDTQKIKSIYFAVAGHGEAMAQDCGHGRAEPVPRLPQHVPVPAEVHGQPPLGGAALQKRRAGGRLRPFFCV